MRTGNPVDWGGFVYLAGQTDRDSAIGEDSTIQQDNRTEIPLIVLSPFILGSIERYNGS
ncbi:hypothetical protein D3C80_2205490 [compost metagenome]